MRPLIPSGCIALIVFLGVLLFPLFLTNVMLTALSRLGLQPEAAVLAVIGIFLGGLVNVPVKRITRDELVEVTPLTLFGLGRFFPQWIRQKQETIIAVNIGGCVVPCVIAVYELVRISSEGSMALVAAIGALSINIAVCYWLARPVPNIGITMPALVPAAVSALCGMVFMPSLAPPIAFVAGVLGPLVGADLLHLKDISQISTGVASIGGAGTFDGVVLSGLIATLLA